MKKQISVTGYISGDYESFCLDVKDSDYEKIKNKQPIEDRKSFFNENRYRLYIKEIFNKLNIEKGEGIL